MSQAHVYQSDHTGVWLDKLEVRINKCFLRTMYNNAHDLIIIKWRGVSGAGKEAWDTIAHSLKFSFYRLLSIYRHIFRENKWKNISKY